MKKEIFSILKEIPLLFIGFFIISLGVSTMLVANLGLSPWGTFHSGLSAKTGISFGVASQLTGLIIIFFSIFLKIYPGIGTILNIYFIGLFIDLINDSGLIPTPISISSRLLFFTIGLSLFSYGLYIYISRGIGAGPRDGLMIGLVKITGISVKYIKPSIEITIIFIGYLIGGTVGIGTVLSGIFGGYILNIIFKFHGYNPKIAKQKNLYDFYLSLKTSR